MDCRASLGKEWGGVLGEMGRGGGKGGGRGRGERGGGGEKGVEQDHFYCHFL